MQTLQIVALASIGFIVRCKCGFAARVNAPAERITKTVYDRGIVGVPGSAQPRHVTTKRVIWDASNYFNAALHSGSGCGVAYFKRLREGILASMQRALDRRLIRRLAEIAKPAHTDASDDLPDIFDELESDIFSDFPDEQLRLFAAEMGDNDTF